MDEMDFVDSSVVKDLGEIRMSVQRCLRITVFFVVATDDSELESIWYRGLEMDVELTKGDIKIV
jgi:hypothetical protein